VITPTAVAPQDPRSYYSVSNQIVSDTPNAVLANQYHNPHNPEAHYRTTGPEIWEQTQGRVTDIVVGMGTGGTITGIARYMRDQGNRVRMIGVDPIGSLLYDAWRHGGSADGLEAFTYMVEGIGEDFIPSTLDLSLVDEVVQVEDVESFRWARRLVLEEGIFGGGSSGAALAGALKAAHGLNSERQVVVIFPDSGDRYLTKLFNDDWMREHGFLEPEARRMSVLDVAQSRGLPSLIVAHEMDLQMDVIAKMRKYAVSQLPVLDNDGALIGILSEVELLEHMLKAENGHSVDDTISAMIDKNIRSAHVDAVFEEVLPDLLHYKVVVLTNDHGRPVNILSVIDALDHISSQSG
jgi:cystathionine beta-synthase